MAGCGTSAALAHPQSLAEKSPSLAVRTSVPLYRFDTEGDLYKGSFDGRPWKLVSKHRFRNPGGLEVRLSSDGRWVAYGNDDVDQLWLYDTLTGSDRKLLDRWNSAAFSPDGKWIALFSDSDSPRRRGIRDPKNGLYLIETNGGTVKFRGAPMAFDRKIGWARLEWSRDGKILLANDGGSRRSSYYLFDPLRTGFVAIGGSYDNKNYRYEFTINGSAIAQQEQRGMQSLQGYMPSTSPDGLYRAEISQADYRLTLHGPGRESRVLDIGSYNDCEGVSMRILGWLEGSKYLVFANGRHSLIAETATGRKAEIPLPWPDPVRSYFW